MRATALCHVVQHHTPELCVVTTDKARGGCNRHVGDKRHDESFEEQREARTFARPGHIDLAHAALRRI